MCYRILKAAIVATCLTALISACATSGDSISETEPTPKWAANGYLSPSPTQEPIIIGLFEKRSDCEEAVAGWLARQVVGNPVSGECLTIDPH